jgi:hypothetical protein
VSRDRFRDPPLPVSWATIGTADPPRDCFADETAIDFPSVDRLVERARVGFLGEGPGCDGMDTLTTELSLSTRDACEGTVIALEVPLRGTCADCGGRGETWTEPCGACRGTGDATVRQPVRLSLPPGVAHGARLHFHVRSPLAVPVRLEVRVAVRSAA